MWMKLTDFSCLCYYCCVLYCPIGIPFGRVRLWNNCQLRQLPGSDYRNYFSVTVEYLSQSSLFRQQDFPTTIVVVIVAFAVVVDVADVADDDDDDMRQL